MNFDDATGFLIGPENEGLNCMFTFMNTARIGTAIQGVGPAELSYQWALDYARERRSMRALSGKKEPDQVADSLIHHADVRRMLLTQKAIAEGGRAMLYYAARLADHMVEGHTAGDEKKADDYDDRLGFLTPILKGFLTELGNEAANLGYRCSAATAISASTAWSRLSATPALPRSMKGPPVSRRWTCWAARCC